MVKRYSKQLTVCAIVLRVQSQYFFAFLFDFSSDKENYLIMVVHKHSLIFLGLPSASNDELHLHKLIHGLDNGFSLHADLNSDVIVAVPTITELYTVGFA